MKAVLFVFTIITLMAIFDIDRLAANESCDTKGEKRTVTELGKRKAQKEVLRINKLEPIPASVRPDDVRHLRLRIRTENALSGNWVATVYDAALHVVQILSPKDFADKPYTWTRRISGGLAHIQVIATNDLDVDPKLYIDSVITMSNAVRFPFYSRQIPGQSAWKPLYQQDVKLQYRQWGDDVGMLMSGHREDNWVCSGVMVSPSLFLTNWHCGGNGKYDFQEADYWSDDICPNSLVDLSWDDDSISRDFACERVEFADQDIDTAVLRVKPIDNQDIPRGARLSNALPKQYENIVIIHHPLGDKKKISLDHCIVQHATRPNGDGLGAAEFTHTCDTESGSSGAPVFNAGGFMVGMHHLGFELQESGICDKVNKAVLLDAILAKIQSANLPLWKEISRQRRTNEHSPPTAPTRQPFP